MGSLCDRNQVYIYRGVKMGKFGREEHREIINKIRFTVVPKLKKKYQDLFVVKDEKAMLELVFNNLKGLTKNGYNYGRTKGTKIPDLLILPYCNLKEDIVILEIGNYKKGKYGYSYPVICINFNKKVTSENDKNLEKDYIWEIKREIKNSFGNNNNQKGSNLRNQLLNILIFNYGLTKKEISDLNKSEITKEYDIRFNGKKIELLDKHKVKLKKYISQRACVSDSKGKPIFTTKSYAHVGKRLSTTGMRKILFLGG